MKKVKAVLSILLVLAMAVSLLACTQTAKTGAAAGAAIPSATASGGAASSDATASSAAAPNLKAADSITIGVTGYLGRFLAGIAPSESHTACDGVFDTIFRIDPKTKQAISDVLESWSWKDDTTFIMKMKQNVTFSNGDQATADDLVFSYLSHHERGSNYLNNMGLILDQCVALDKSTAQFKFEKPYSAFTGTSIYLIDKAWSQKVGWDSQDWYNPVCSGPYKVTDYVADDHITLQARDDYWNKDAGPIAVRQWILKYYPDPATMYMDLEVGNLKMCEVQSSDYSRFKKDGGDGFKCFLKPTGVCLYFAFGYNDNPAWKDQKLREAIAYGINWQEMGKLTYGDMFIPAKSLTPEASPQFINPGAREYNPDKAKQLLAEAGYGPGQLKLQTFLMDTPEYKNLAESFQFYANQIGVDVSIKYGDVSTAISEWIVAGGTDFGWMWSIGGSPSFDLYTGISQSNDKHGITWTYVDDDNFQKLFTDMVYTTDKDLQLKSAKELQQLVFDKTLMIPVAENASAIGYSTSVFTDEQMQDYVIGAGIYQIGRLGMASAWE